MAVPSPADYEKLGVFYLGRRHDLEARAATDDLVLYDSRDLTTHALCVGMTGSGKTGLCVGLLEEAVIDGVPAIIIDPKGDLANLLLTFPALETSDFVPWVTAEDARRKGMSTVEFASAQAELWRKGLADWGQSSDRIARLRDSASFSIYTPGGDAGLKVSVLASFAAPPESVRSDAELFRQQASTTVSSLLGLLGVEADPLQSREHILLTTLLMQSWQAGRDCDLATLITQIQSPPLKKVGVLDLEAFYPAKDRFVLVMKLNNLVASPGFAAWTEGDALDVDALLRTAEGKPRVSIFSIAHLSDSERMFFVSLLLNEVVSWMRRQGGTSSLRSILYMDEIAGYFPPTANPPSKAPLLTLLKQARAFGVGVVLATQNPVDLDYKGLANIGTWFIGRLQTERDKARLLDGLRNANQSAGAGFDDQELDRILSSLGNRVFLVNNVHEDHPVVMQTRWTLSYLGGPVDRDGIRRLMGGSRPAAPGVAAAAPVQVAAAAPFPMASEPAPAAAPGTAPVPGAGRPPLPPEVNQVFLPVRLAGPGGAALSYEPRVAGVAEVLFADSRAGISATRRVMALAPVTDAPVPVTWAEAEKVEVAAADLAHDPSHEGTFTAPAPAVSQAKQYAGWGREFAQWLVANETLELWRSPSTGLVSNPGENERDFRARLAQAARETRDAAVDALRKKQAPKLASLDARLERARQAVEREKSQSHAQMMQTAISVGTSLLGLFSGRKKLSATNLGRAATAARGVGRTMKESGDVDRVAESVEVLTQQRAALEAELAAEVEKLQAATDPATEKLDPVVLRATRPKVTVQLLALAWCPYWTDSLGNQTPAW